MSYLRRLGSHFDPVYIKPTNLGRAVNLLGSGSVAAPAVAQQQLSPRREQDRRCGVERRRQQQPILLDTRSPHARRKLNRRRQQDMPFDTQAGAGIDVYA